MLLLLLGIADWVGRTRMQLGLMVEFKGAEPELRSKVLALLQEYSVIERCACFSLDGQINAELRQVGRAPYHLGPPLHDDLANADPGVLSMRGGLKDCVGVCNLPPRADRLHPHGLV